MIHDGLRETGATLTAALKKTGVYLLDPRMAATHPSSAPTSPLRSAYWSARGCRFST